MLKWVFPSHKKNVLRWQYLCYTRYQSHKWTIYVRGASNEDLGVIVKRVVFQLHTSFNNPTRIVDAPPFELSEAGWGEFEIAITLYFHSDVCDKPVNLWVVWCCFWFSLWLPVYGANKVSLPFCVILYSLASV